MPETQALELQAGLVAALKADATLSALVGAAVFDEPPQSQPFPYVRLGGIDEETRRASCDVAYDYRFSIEVHSRPAAGRVEAARIAGAVRDALNGNASLVPIDGYVLRWIEHVTTTTARAADGRSYVARVAFSAWVDPLP